LDDIFLYVFVVLPLATVIVLLLRRQALLPISTLLIDTFYS